MAEVFTPNQLTEITAPKSEAPKSGSNDFLATLKQANEFVNTIKGIISAGQGLIKQASPQAEKQDHFDTKLEKEVNKEMAKAGASKPRVPNTPTTEKKLIVDVPMAREYLLKQLEQIKDDMNGKDAKEMIKPILQGDTFDKMIEDEIKKFVRLE